MLRDVLDAFVAKDATRARAIIERDEQVDALYAQVSTTGGRALPASPV